MADYLNPLNSKVDAPQVLIRAYDETLNRLRVDALVTATLGSVDVIIDAASGDNIKISDGVDTLLIEPDGSINVNVVNITLDHNDDSVEVFQATHDNLNANANVQQNNTDVSVSNPLYTQTTNGNLESTQQLVLTQLQNLNTSTDNIEADAEAIRVETVAINAELDTQTTLLTQIRDNADTVETLLSGILTNTGDLETLGATTNSLLTQIRDYVDTVEILIASTNTKLDTSNTQLTAINANTDGLEGLVTSSNALLTQIRDYVDTVEPLITASNVQLTAINSNTDGLEGLITTSNTLLTAIGNNTDTLETLIASTNTKLDTVISTLATINGKIANDYGASSGAIRTASQIGNTTGAANFNAGTTGAQTLRTSSNITRNGTELSYNDGASDANTIRTSSNVKFDGTTPALNAGTTNATTQRVTANITRNGTELSYNDGASDANTQRVSANLKFDGTTPDKNFGTVGANTLRTAAQVGNATGAADFGNGNVSVQTLRTALAADQFSSVTSIQNTSNTTAVNTATIIANQTNGTQKSLMTDLTGNLAKINTNGAQQMVLTNQGDGTKFATFTNNNRLRINLEGTSLITDKFDGVAVDTNQWASTVGGTGTVGIGSGFLNLSTGLTLSNLAYLQSTFSLGHPGNAFLQFGAAMKLETTTIATNTRRHWGYATGGGTYATPLTDGVVFEVDDTGTLRASIYNAGVRTFTTVLTAVTDGNYHRYDIFYNTQNISWYIDNGDVPVASTTLGLNPSVQTLPTRISMFNNTATPPSTTPTLQCQAISVTDTARNSAGISDGIYGFRKAEVNSNRELRTVDNINNSGIQGSISVGTSATAVRVGASNLANRKNLTFAHNGTTNMFWGYTSGVTTATGTPMFRNQYVSGDWGPNTTIFIISASGTNDLRVTEGS